MGGESDGAGEDVYGFPGAARCQAAGSDAFGAHDNGADVYAVLVAFDEGR